MSLNYARILLDNINRTPSSQLYSRQTDPSHTTVRFVSPSNNLLPTTDKTTTTQMNLEVHDSIMSGHDDKYYSKELDVAVKAVHMACLLSQTLQQAYSVPTRFTPIHSNHHTLNLPLSDWGVKAIVSWVLSEAFSSQEVHILAEEDDVQELITKAESTGNGILQNLVKAVNDCLAADAPRFGLTKPAEALCAKELTNAINGCKLKTGSNVKRFWVLGTAETVSLSLIEHGAPVIGVLGFRYPLKTGCVLYARRGGGGTWMQPLLPHRESINDSRSSSSHHTNNMMKYAAIAKGDAEALFMKFARAAGEKEKIWDHAAGVVIVQEAGGVVSDVGGDPLNFSSKGCIYLEGLDRGIIACAGPKLHESTIRAVDASWCSSCL